MVIAWFYLLEMVSKMAARLFYVDSMFQPFNYVVVKTGIFDKNLVEKSHKDIYIT